MSRRGRDAGVRPVRGLHQRVRTARGRKKSSTRWLERQLNDPYVRRARSAGFRARSAFKLIEIDDRVGILKPGRSVVDLGAAPGAWTQVAVERTRSRPGDERVLAVDILEMEPVDGARILQADIREPETSRLIRETLDGPVDVVLSDLAAPTTGHRATDHRRTLALCELAYDLAVDILAPGGALVAKVFQGGTESALLARMKRQFKSVRHVKPPASRKESPETYVVARGFRSSKGD